MAKESKKTKKKKNIISVDFTGVQKGFARIKPGDYRAKVIAIEPGESNEGNDKLDWFYEITEGKAAGQRPLPYNTTLTPQSLWNLRTVLEAHGIETEEDVMDLDLDEILETADEVIISIDDNVYNGKTSSKITGIASLALGTSEDDEEEDEEEKPSKKKSKKPSKKEEVEEDDEEETELTSADILKMDEDELSGVIEEHDLDVDLDDHDSIKAKRKAVAEAFDEGSSEDEGADDEEEDEESDSYSQDDIDEMGTKELAALVKKHKLKVNLDSLSNTRKKRKAVSDALKKEGLLD